MTRSSRRSSPLAALAAVVLALGATTASWGTFCIGEDGHIAFEAVAAGDCVGGGATAGPSAAVGAVQGARPCCGPCTDLERTGAEWLAAGLSAADGTGPAATQPAERVVAFLPMRVVPPAAQGLAHAKALRTLASTIIRC